MRKYHKNHMTVYIINIRFIPRILAYDLMRSTAIFEQMSTTKSYLNTVNLHMI